MAAAVAMLQVKQTILGSV
ncbi:hypothetical protein KUF71_004285 [Frankliniella fusca]|uniref:Uncharacterized protein n=1 Tax=Frankliniella fusca TaxID=407009 RepID=A0AAE1GX21_9NEOP|nr:hypothetical protein KUF71_019894 [Frankliniella fusca]KAK3910797.1 hypothetical protein KUF71_004285 [Frankliniella fusca]